MTYTTDPTALKLHAFLQGWLHARLPTAGSPPSDCSVGTILVKSHVARLERD